MIFSFTHTQESDRRRTHRTRHGGYRREARRGAVRPGRAELGEGEERRLLADGGTLGFLRADPSPASRPARRKGNGREGDGAGHGSKRERVLQLLRQPDGATLQALVEATGWQAHSIRGFISGSLSKGMGLKIESFKWDGERVYAVQS
jgi:hypothetical protein